MRLALLATFVTAGVACSVPDKHASTTDGGTDAMLPVDDMAIPETTITSAPPEFANGGSSTFEFAANYANVTFECSIDGETAMPCTSPYTRVLPDGAHNFSVRAINRLGEGDETPAEHLWMIDTVAPNTMLVEVPPPADNSVMVRFVFMSSEENVTFDCSLDNGSYVPCTSMQEFGPLGDGSHSFAVRAHDRAGNVDASPAIHAWTVDTSTPDTQLLSGPDGAVASRTATFTFVSPDAGGGATFQCALDGAIMEGCTSPHTLTNLSEGQHTFQVRVRDAVGNLDPTPATRTWTVDLAAPETMIDSGPEGMVRVASAVFTFSSTEAGVSFMCSLDGGAYTPCTSPQSYPSLGQGSHSFAVRAIDAANQPDPTPATRSWIVDTVPPDVMITSGPAEGATVGPRVSVAFTVSEGTPSCSLDGAPFTACDSPLATNLPAGAHELRIRATDGAGNVTTAVRTFTVACAAPPAAGAAGLLHLDDNGQTLANATGGASAINGTTDQAEAVDVTFGPGRFGGAAVFAAAEGDVITWPAALGATSDVTVELWTNAASGDVFVSGDGALAIRAVSMGSNTRFSVTAGGASVQSAPVPANAWHHVVASRGGGTLRLWVDGARVQTAAGGAGAALDSITLGGNLTGSLDEVWVAQTAATDDDAALARYCPM